MLPKQALYRAELHPVRCQGPVNTGKSIAGSRSGTAPEAEKPGTSGRFEDVSRHEYVTPGRLVVPARKLWDEP